MIGDEDFEGRTWYAAVAKLGQMRDAEERLDKQGYAAYAPMALVRRVTGGQIEDAVRPMLGRYFFVGLSWGQPLAPVRSTRGVAYLAQDGGGKPLRVRLTELQKIKARCDADGGVLDLRPIQARSKTARARVDWRPGQMLRLTEGPFADLVATLLRLDGDHATAQVLVEIFGRPTPVGVPVGALHPVGGGASVSAG